jgi:lincosamide nucleotidyltransferase A/C/D/E
METSAATASALGETALTHEAGRAPSPSPSAMRAWRRVTTPGVTGADVIEVLDWLEAVGVRTWVDGGWGIDALVGDETRRHADLDLALDRNDLDVARRALEEREFHHALNRHPGLPARLVMQDGREREVDLHPLIFDAAGDGWQQLSASGMAWGWYPADDLRATGAIGGRPTRCLSPELQLRFRLGYEWSDRDVHDVRLLIERFGVPAPPPLVRRPRP